MADQKFLKYITDYLLRLVEKYGFSKTNEINDRQSYSIEYSSSTFVIKLEKYWHEFYVILYKVGYKDSGINLFNLLSYLKQPNTDTPTSKYFEEEKDLDQRYKKQLTYIVDIITNNFDDIDAFFKSGNYELKVQEITSFMLKKYPNLFKRQA